MSDQGSRNSGRSFSSQDESLRRDTPVSLKEVHAANPQFNRVTDPWKAKQLEDMNKTEAQRREEGSRGSEMVKKDKPTPALKPSNENEPVRQTFNKAWLKEHRDALRSNELNSREPNKDQHQAHTQQTTRDLRR